jgi:hypothetical protein
MVAEKKPLNVAVTAARATAVIANVSPETRLRMTD